MFASHRRIRVALALCSVLGLGAVGTWAAFTDNAQFTTNFTTGSVGININSEDDPVPVTFDGATNMQIGDVLYQSIIVNNDGTLPLQYTMAAPVLGATDDTTLANQLLVSVKEGVTDCAAGGWGTDGTAVITDLALSGATITAPRELAEPSNTSGAPTSETLCFKVALPSGDNDNDFSGLSVNPTFTLNATQVTPVTP